MSLDRLIRETTKAAEDWRSDGGVRGKLDIGDITISRTIKDGAIFYRIRQQDGSFVQMNAPNNHSMRRFVEWVQVHD